MPTVDHRPRSATTRWLRVAGVAGLALVVAGVLILKGQVQSSTSSVSEVQSAEAGDRDAVAQATAELELPEVQLDRLVAGGQPTLAFFHSNTCYQCVEMTGIVERVYPEY